MAVRKADIQQQEETRYVALEASDWAPEPREGDYVHVWEREGWGVWGGLEKAKLASYPSLEHTLSPNKLGIKGWVR